MQVNSFDLFDTLIFRACYYPENIFSIIERDKNIDNFKNNRMRYQDPDFKTTYKNLQNHYKWNDKYRDEIMEYELYIEEDNIYPIQTNINMVSDEDIIVSDMYLYEDFLKKILTKFGLGKNKLYLTYSGKYDGYIWDIIKKDGYIVKNHYGDNEHSDIKMPKKYNIETIKLTNSFFTSEEKLWNDSLALAIRFVRLHSGYKQDSIFEEIYKNNYNNNIPLLLYYSQYIFNFASKNKFDKLLFSTRDCLYLYIIYKKLYKDAMNPKILFTSRACYTDKNPEYDDYISKMLGNKTLIIDLHGSGKSFENYFVKYIKNPNVHLLFFNTNNLKVSNEQVHYIFNSDKITHFPELLNLVSFGTVNTFKDNIPCFLDLEYPSYIVEPIESCIKNLTTYIDKFYQNNKIDYQENYFNYKSSESIIKMFFNQKLYSKNKIYKFDKKNYAKFKETFNLNTPDDNLQIEKYNYNYKYKNIKDIQCVIINQNKNQELENTKKLLKNLGFENIKVINILEPTKQTQNQLKLFLNSNRNINSSEEISAHFLTYLNILKDNNYKEDLFIFEDNITPTYSIENTKKILDFSINNYPENTDMFYFEFCFENCNNFTQNFTQLNKPYCTGCIYYPSFNTRDKIINKILQYYKNNQEDFIDSIENILANLINSNSIFSYSHTPIFQKNINSYKSCNNQNINVIHDILNIPNHNQNISNHKLKNNKTLYLIILIILILILIITLILP